MFDLFSWSHILILLVVALVVVGPKDLPRLMHMVGRWVGKARGMANEFKKSFDDMARQTELDELRKEIEALKTTNPIADIQNALNEAAVTATAAPLPVAPLPEAGPEPRSGEFAVTQDVGAALAQTAEPPKTVAEPPKTVAEPPKTTAEPPKTMAEPPAPEPKLAETAPPP